jgi:predicted ester cyclase
MSNSEHKALVERFYEELWNEWNFEAIDEILSPDVVFHGSLGMDRTGHAGFIDYAELVRATFPDFHNTVAEMIAEGDRLAACLTYRGTHEGEIFDIEPTGRAISYAGVAIFVFQGGLISQVWVLGDRLALIEQLTDGGPA